jgi:Zn-dependent protease with chaperone function
MCCTAHWYNPEKSEMKTLALELNRFQEHDADTVSAELLGTMERFLVDPPVMTSDNHLSNVSAFNKPE